uniref:Uncharacterized protein n=1 Tax=Schistocephalus solidus TaxID=70667 RepID=A0A0X3NIE5_SCHSO
MNRAQWLMKLTNLCTLTTRPHSLTVCQVSTGTRASDPAFVRGHFTTEPDSQYSNQHNKSTHRIKRGSMACIPMGVVARRSQVFTLYRTLLASQTWVQTASWRPLISYVLLMSPSLGTYNCSRLAFAFW